MVRLLIFLLFCSITAGATVYKLSPTDPAANFTTLAQLNAQSYVAGDSIQIEKGSVYYGTITISNSGTVGNPITYTSYGTGANPIITGFTTITGWTNETGGIYSKVITADSQSNMVTIDGVQYGMGRYPNSTYLTYESASASVSITDNELTGTPSWTGADAVITKNGWLIDRCVITNHTTTTLTVTTATTTNFSAPNNYFFQNALQTLDTYGEWYHDYAGTGKFYMFFGGIDPTTKTVKVATKDYLVNCTNPDYIVIDGIEFIGSTKENIKTASSDYSIIQNNTITFSGRDAIAISGVGDTVRNNTIIDCNRVGVYSTGGNITIIGNTITNSGVIEGQGNIAPYYGGAIFIYNDVFSIVGNTIINCGFDGVALSSLTNAGNISQNTIDNACTLRSDQGAIYTSGTSTGITIHQNTILNSKGNGIYLDEYSSNVTVSNNIVYNSNSNGIKLHKASTNTITGNFCFGNDYGINFENWLNEDNLSYNVVTGNKFISLTGQYALRYITRYTSYVTSLTTCSIDNNYYARPIDDVLTIATDIPSFGLSYKTFEQWKTFCSQDANSEKSPTSVTDDADIQFEYNGTAAESSLITFTLPMIDITGTRYVGSTTLQPYSANVFLVDPSPLYRPLIESNGKHWSINGIPALSN